MRQHVGFVLYDKTTGGKIAHGFCHERDLARQGWEPSHAVLEHVSPNSVARVDVTKNPAIPVLAN